MTKIKSNKSPKICIISHNQLMHLSIYKKKLSEFFAKMISL